MPFSPQSQQIASEPLSRFFDCHISIFDFFFFGLSLATSIDRSRFVAAEALAIGGAEKHVRYFEELKLNKDATLQRLTGFSELQSENMCIRLVDNFVNYLSEMIQACMIKRPEILRSKEMISIEDILRFSTRKELVAHLVDRKLNELTYGGIREIDRFLLERTGIRVATAQEKDKLSFAIEVRNIHTHNRGRVSDITLRRLAGVEHGYQLTKGQYFHAGYDTIVEISNNIASIARRLDEQLAPKFRLRTKTYQSWRAQRSPTGKKLA